MRVPPGVCVLEPDCSTPVGIASTVYGITWKEVKKLLLRGLASSERSAET